MKRNSKQGVFFTAVLVLFFCASFSYAAEVYYLGGNSSAPASTQNSAFSIKQRVKDLLDFSLERVNDQTRSGRMSGNFLQEIDYNDIAGNKTKSFLRAGVEYLSELHINIQEKLAKDYNFEGQWFLRKTDNPRIESRRDVRLKQINVKAYNQKNLFEFGDFYGDFSQFVLGTSLEGFNVEVAPTGNQKYKFIAARSQDADPVNGKFQRNTFGAKADLNFFKDSTLFSKFRVGAQAATVQDDSSSIDSNTSTKDLRNIVASIDGEFSLQKYFSMMYEIARSDYIEDEDTSNDNQFGTALRLQPSLSLGKVQLRYLYYYGQPKFYTDVGSASSDKIQHQISADITFHRKVALSISENYYFDHLTGSSRTKRTLNDEKYFVLNIRPFDARQGFMLRPYANYQIRSSDDMGNSAGAITRTVGFSLNDSLDEHTSAGVSYEYRGFTDTATRTTSEYFNRIGFNFARDQKLFNKRLYYSLDPSVDLRRTKTDDDKDVSIAVGLNMQYDIASWLIMRAGNSIADTNGAKVATDYFNNRAFWEFDYILSKQRSTHVILRGERNNYVSEDGAQSYREQRIIAKFISNF